MEQKEIIRLSLPKGTKVTSTGNTTYTVGEFLSRSERSLSVLCQSPDGKEYWLKLYNGRHCMTEEKIKAVKEIPASGIVPMADFGYYTQHLFCIFPILAKAKPLVDAVSPNLLMQTVIPQMHRIIRAFHSRGILLRDICPEHILYDPLKEQIFYCGLSNPSILPEHVTATKEQGYGQEIRFLAPEVPNKGYSRSSDYYSLAVTILSMVMGNAPLQGLSWQELQSVLYRSNIPGVDLAHLKTTPYKFYSSRDKVIYLVLGLILPDPAQRWGEGELRCWCRGYGIPLIRRGGRVEYQYSTPFQLGRVKCWNHRQLAKTLASDKTVWTEEMVARLDQFSQTEPECGFPSIRDCPANLSGPGKLLRYIYDLDPALDGLWWCGEDYADTDGLIKFASQSRENALVLSEILRNHGLSGFLKARSRISHVQAQDIAELEAMESCEIQTPGKGVRRCLLRYAADRSRRSFHVGETETFHSLEELLEAYSGRGRKLKEISGELLLDEDFQAWLWAEGLEAAGEHAAGICRNHPEHSFYLLLGIMENNVSQDSLRRDIRELYLRYGEYANIYWLQQHLQEYHQVSISSGILVRSLQAVSLSTEQPLAVLSQACQGMVADYQMFVLRTARNMSDINMKTIHYAQFSYYPDSGKYLFSDRWENGMRICPEFRKTQQY